MEEYEEIKEGWVDKPKSLLQVCWEHGLLKPTVLNLDKAYTINGHKNCLGIQDNDYSLTHLLGGCLDIEEEEMMLQAMGHSLGVLVDRAPKCHPELAGEGIEYFGVMPRITFSSYRWRKKEKFMGSMKKSLAIEVLNQDHIIKFSN